MVPHRSTNRARACLTSLSRREAVLSCWYGRSHQRASLFKLLNCKGIINIGGSKQTPYNFAKKDNKKVLPISAKKIYGKNYPSKQSMTIKNYLEILKNK